ncbi:MAG: trigger factor, partial [Cytophagales bacterium]
MELVERKTKEYGKKIAIKGFRPGKVPASYVKKMYGTSIKYEEINQIISQNISEYLSNNKINLLRDPIPSTSLDNIDLNQDVEYKFNFDLFIVPEFEAPMKMKLNAYEVTLSEETLEAKIQELRENLSETVEKEIVEENDFIGGNLKKSGTEAEPFKTGVMFGKLSDEGKKIFIGQAADSVVKFDIKQLFGDDINSLRLFAGVDKEEAGKLEGEYQFTIETISGKKPAELNEELFGKIFPGEEITTIEKFKERYSEILLNHARNVSTTLQKRELEKWLDEQVDVKISEEYLAQLKQDGDDETKLENIAKYLKEEKVVQRYFEELKPNYNQQEFFNFLLDIYAQRTGMSSSYYSLPDWAQKVVKEQVEKLYAKENAQHLNYYNFVFIKELVVDELLKRQNDFNNVSVDYNELLKKLEA